MPDSEVCDEWKSSAKDEMLETCHLKFSTCEHVRECLLETRITLAEVTKDPYWGTGLMVQQTHECLPDFWPGSSSRLQMTRNIRCLVHWRVNKSRLFDHELVDGFDCTNTQCE